MAMGGLRGGAATVLLLLTLAINIGHPQKSFQSTPEHKIDGEVVNLWGTRFGTELWESLTRATRRDEIQKGYDGHSELGVEEIDGFQMIKRMAAEVQVMMQHKIDAIKRIMELAENIALDHKYDKDMGHRLKAGGFS